MYEFNHATPTDIMFWAKVEANNFHSGAGTGPFEMTDEVENATKAWEKYCDNPGEGKKPIRRENCLTRGPLRFEKQHETYVLGLYGNVFGSVLDNFIICQTVPKMYW